METDHATFYLVRHGQTEANVRKVMQGAHTDTPLTEVGKTQAQDLGQSVRDAGIELIITSPAQRARETANLIAQQLNPAIPIAVSQEINERDMGDLDGKPYTIFETELHDVFGDYNSLPQDEKFENSLAGMESDKDVSERLINYLQQLFEQYKNKTILLVTHGGVIKSFLQHLGFATYDELASNSVSPSGYIKVSSDGREFRLLETKGVIKNV